jgi:hypothetical protein
MYSARAAAIPLFSAVEIPSFRSERTSTMRGSCAAQRSRIAAVPSVEPSSTMTNSKPV